MTPERLQEINDAELKHFSPDTDTKIDWEVVDLPTLKMLDNAREYSGIAYRISSNHRDADNPAGFPTDAHRDVPCKAFDIIYNSSNECFLIVMGLFKAGFTRIGINGRNFHIHADASTSRPQNVLFLEK